MISEVMKRRLNLVAVILSLLLIIGLFQLPAAHAESTFSIDEISVDKASVYPGEPITVTIKWTNTIGVNVATMVSCDGASTTQQLNLGPSSTTNVSFTIDLTANPGYYNVTVSSDDIQKTLNNAFEVKEVFIYVENIVPSNQAPVTVFAGDTVNVSFNYTSPITTTAEITIGSLVAKSINLSKTTSLKTASTTIAIPELSAAGDYNLRLAFDSSNSTYTQSKAITIKNKPTVELSITSPTRSNPSTVRPGDSLTVRVNYSMTNDTPVLVRLAQGSSSVLVSKEVTLSKSKTSENITLSIPTSAAVGKYNLTVEPKAGGSALDTELDAIFVEHRVTANITSPTRSKPVSVSGGDKVTVTFDYTADNRATVEIRLQQSDSDVLLTSSVTLDRSTSSKSRSVSITIPSGASGGKYDLVVRAPLSGTALDTERDAVIVDAKITADITSPTRSKPVTVKSGGSLPVKFDYTSNANASVDIKILKPDGKELTSTSSTLDKTTTKKSKTVSVSIPSSAGTGKYGVVITAKYSGKVLDTETQAITVEDPLTVKIHSPTTAYPANFNTTGKVIVKFNYTAESSSNAEFRLLRPDGKVLAYNTVYLSRSSTTKTENLTINLPSVTPVATYDLEIINKDSGNRVALENKSVSVVSYPLNVRVQFVIGQSGRWVNGTFQTTDLDARIIQGRTLLPIRHVGEPLGWQLKWDDSSKMATVIKGERQVRVWVNNNSGQVSTDSGRNWKTVKIDPNNTSVQPVLISGRVLLPLRFVSESLATKVDWDATTRTVTVVQD